MAFKCGASGYDNVDDALMYNMCQEIFRKEKKAAPIETLPTPATPTAAGSVRTAGAERPKTIEGLDAMGWHERGLECLKNQQSTAALECYEKSLAIEPRFTKAWGNKATLLHISGKNDEALQAIDSALRIDPLYMSCWYTKAIIEYTTKRYPQAMRSFNEVLTFPINIEQDMIQNAENAMGAMQEGGVQAVERDALGWGRRKAHYVVGRASLRAECRVSTKPSSSIRKTRSTGIKRA